MNKLAFQRTGLEKRGRERNERRDGEKLITEVGKAIIHSL